MKRLVIAGVALALLVPACAFAQSVFDGTWILDATTVHESGGQPMVIALKDGMYHCNCHPPIDIKADGLDHAVKGHHGTIYTLAIKVLNDHSIQETYKKDGKVLSERTLTAAPNGKTATGMSTIYRGASPSTAKVVLKRVAGGAPGSNAVAGAWRLEHVINGSGAIFDPTYKIDGNTVTFSDAAGDAYTATLGGKAVPSITNGKADGTVAVKMLGKDTLRETYFGKNGKEVSTSTMTISPDGKTMKEVDYSVESGVTTTQIDHKAA